MKVEADAAKREAIETERRKVAEKKAKTEAERRALEAERARLQQQWERDAGRAQEQAERRAAEATVASMEEAKKKICRERPPGGSPVDTLRRFFDRDPASRMKIGLDAEGCWSSEGSGSTTRPRRKGGGRTPERPPRSGEWHPHDSNPFVTCSDRDGPSCRPRHKPEGCKVGGIRAGGGGGENTHPSSGVEGPSPPYGSRQSTPGRPPPGPGPRLGDMDIDGNMEVGPDTDPSNSGGPQDGGPPGPPSRRPPGGPPEGGPSVGPPYVGPPDRKPPGEPPGEEPPNKMPGGDVPEDIW